jgi:hypothetical protein
MRQVIELREYSAENNYLKNNKENRESEENRVPEHEKSATSVPVPEEEEQGTSRTEISQEPKKKTARRMRYINHIYFRVFYFNADFLKYCLFFCTQKVPYPRSRFDQLQL